MQGPCKIVKRAQKKECYLLAKDGVYVTSTSQKKGGEGYLAIMEALAAQIDEGSIKTKDEAKEWMLNNSKF